MKLTFATLALLSCAHVVLSDTVRGFDIADYYADIDWSRFKTNGLTFVYIEATKGSNYISNPYRKQYLYASHYEFFYGAYHVAVPGMSSGANQAGQFIGHGGMWAATDEKRLPGAVELVQTPSGDRCYGLLPAAMVNWIKDFSDTYHSATGRFPVIKTSTEWWKTCTGNDPSFGSTNPLWIISHSTSPGPLPNGWTNYAFWQVSSKGFLPGPLDSWKDSTGDLQRFAKMA